MLTVKERHQGEVRQPLTRGAHWSSNSRPLTQVHQKPRSGLAPTLEEPPAGKCRSTCADPHLGSLKVLLQEAVNVLMDLVNLLFGDLALLQEAVYILLVGILVVLDCLQMG